jgi:hypothetical protein
MLLELTPIHFILSFILEYDWIYFFRFKCLKFYNIVLKVLFQISQKYVISKKKCF